MDFEAQRKKRMEDLANKRKRLEEMRRQRSEKMSTTGATEDITVEATKSPPTPPVLSHEAESVDELVNSLLSKNDEPPAVTSPQKEEAPPEPLTSVLSRLELIQERSKEWTTCQNVCFFSIEPHFPEVYEKSVQTDISQDIANDRTDDDDEESHSIPEHMSSPSQRTPQRTRRRSRADSCHSVEKKPLESKVKEFTQDEVQDILATPNFQSFLLDSSRIVERALGLSNSIDLLRDLTGRESTISDSSNNSHDILQRSRLFTNEVAVGKRPVMDMQMSSRYSELFVVSYGSSALNTTTRDSKFLHENSEGGLVCLWSILLPEAPEFVFTAPSPVLAIRFHPENVHLLIGACYSGQILIWDTRNNSPRASHRTSSSGRGHKHPVYSINFFRRGNSNSATSSNESDWVLLTASTDGLLCHWDIDDLSDPISSTQLTSPLVFPAMRGLNVKSKNPPSSSAAKDENVEKPISISCMAIGPEEDSMKLVMGSECGTLFCFPLPFKSNAPFRKTSAHFGMITSLSVNPSALSKFKHLLLTSSVDWTVKLWHLQDIDDESGSRDAVEPILSFPSSCFQYVTSVEWSPVHPGVFSAIASGGKLMVWNICQSVVEPVGAANIETKQDSDDKSGVAGINALNKTVWLDDGRKLLVGDSSGGCHCMSIHSSNAVSLRSGDEDRLELAISSSKKISIPKEHAPNEHKTLLFDENAAEEK